MKKRVFSIARRPFLGALGSAAGAAVFLRPIIAEAEGEVPKRFCIIHFPVGTVYGIPGEGQGAKWYWLPSGAGPNYVASPLLKLFEDRPADNIYTFVNGASVRKSLLPIDGIDLLEVNQPTPGDKHSQNMHAMTTGWMSVPIDNAPVETDPANAKQITIRKGTKTIDQHLLDAVPDLTKPLIAGSMGPQFTSLQLCGTAKSMANQGFTCLKVLSYAGNNMPLFGEGRSANAFMNIFGMAMMPGADPATLMRQQAQKRSVLDFVISDIQRMQAMVPVGQRGKLDAQLTSIRALEQRISAETPTTMITPPTLVSEPLTGNAGANVDEARHQMLIRNMFEIIRCAFLSDLTRVVSMTLGDGNHPNRPLMFCPKPGFAANGIHHDVSHLGKGADAIEAKGEASAVHLGAVADFLKSMAATPEGPAGETLLDHTLGHLFTECRDGDTHERRRVPTMLFGGKFLKLNSGQLLVVSNPDRYTNDLSAAIFAAFGAPMPNGVYGDPMYGKGVLPGVFGP